MSLSDYADDGYFAPKKIAALLATTQDDLAQSVGLGRDAVTRRDRIRAAKTQRRLREMVEVLNKVTPRFGSPMMAYAWYRSQPLAGFAGQTAMQLSQAGRSMDVLEYIDAVDAGIYS